MEKKTSHERLVKKKNLHYVDIYPPDFTKKVPSHELATASPLHVACIYSQEGCLGLISEAI